MQSIANAYYALLSRANPARALKLRALISDPKAMGFLGDTLQKLFARDALLSSRAFFRQNAERVEHVLSLMADEKSREAYRSLIQYRCYRKRRYINPHMQPKENSYLDRELVVPLEDEVFVDCGAYSGDSSLAFQAFCVSAGKPAPLCVLFEPEPANFTQLQKWLPEFERVPFLFQMGLWSKAGQLHFTPGLYTSSKIEEAGESSIEVDTLDHVLEGIPGLPPVTYIKIDVEGADLDALYGARNTIERYRPRIAVAIYHNDEHMIGIPEAIAEMCPAYRFFIRHYSSHDGETVLYCL